MARVARVGNDIPDVLNASDEHDEALEAQAKACVGDGAVASQVPVPPVVLDVEAHLRYPAVQHVQALLALGPADDLADARGQDVHGGDGLLVVVEAHVEGLDVLGVVVQDRGLLVDLLGQISLVLGAEVHAPLDGHLELGLRGLLDQDLDGFRVRQALEGFRQEVLQPRDEPLLNLLVEEFQVGPVVLHRVSDAVLQVVLGTLHVVLDVGEGELGLDHPEFGEVPRGVRVLGTEGGSERVHVGEGTAIVLDAKLTTDGEVRRLAEEVLRVVDFLVRSHGQLAAVLLGIRHQGRHLEHLAGTLAVRGGDERRVHVDEVPLTEELVRGVGQGVAHAGHGADDGGAGSKVPDGTEKLHAVLALGHRVVRGVHAAEKLDLVVRFLEQELHGLLGRRALDQHAVAHHGGAGAAAALEALVARHGRVQDHLQTSWARTIGELQKHDLLLVTHGADPSADADLATNQRLAGLEDLLDLHAPADRGGVLRREAGVVEGRRGRRGRGGGGRGRRRSAARGRGRGLAAPQRGATNGLEGLMSSARVQPALNSGRERQLELSQRAAQGNIGQSVALPDEVGAALKVGRQLFDGGLPVGRLRTAELHLRPIEPGIHLSVLDEGAAIDVGALEDAADAPDDRIGVSDDATTDVQLRHAGSALGSLELEVDACGLGRDLDLECADVVPGNEGAHDHGGWKMRGCRALRRRATHDSFG
mmetsp:Transcript_29576/g.84843  ORF Transcript_29576/g.84843 Transcript_29576/m.84843 type:complete len:703 (+) Transcript_29576:138-2246(+)